MTGPLRGVVQQLDTQSLEQVLIILGLGLGVGLGAGSVYWGWDRFYLGILTIFDEFQGLLRILRVLGSEYGITHCWIPNVREF